MSDFLALGCLQEPDYHEMTPGVYMIVIFGWDTGRCVTGMDEDEARDAAEQAIAELLSIKLVPHTQERP